MDSFHAPDLSVGNERLADWFRAHRHIFVLTGAGCSTASGIPDYRDAEGHWKRSQPVTYQALTTDPSMYRRYWARSSVGWPRFKAARPNAAHLALAELEARGSISMLLTQNVDGLHQRAGSRNVVDLHGRLDRVTCLGCHAGMPRDALQDTIERANPGWEPVLERIAPDGDAEIDDASLERFVPPFCIDCGGLLKPDVVFFGEQVPRERVERARDALLASDAMLVAGSSLMVYSGYRFARMAEAESIPLAILNRGRTRADDIAAFHVDGDIGAILQDALR